jgi:hypothetical protein
LKALSFCDFCASLETMTELDVVLDRSKFDRYLNREQRQAFAANVRRRVHLFEVRGVDLTEVVSVCRDPSDNMFLALALVAEADAIVSSDQDLLVLHPWREIQILPPAGFISVSPGEHP